MNVFRFLRLALSEDNGNPSSTRLNVFIALIQWSIAITFGFFWVVIIEPELVLGYLGILAALTAGLLGIKAWQKGKEKSTPGDPPPVG